MSGREAEPIAAFFPSIDRSLMRDLDRHLRNPRQASPAQAPGGDAVKTPDKPPSQQVLKQEILEQQVLEQQVLEQQTLEQVVPQKAVAHGAARPTVDTIVEAVEQAASTMAAMTHRIQALEETIDEIQHAHHDTSTQLAEALRHNTDTEASLRAERERGTRAETLAAHHIARANRLEVELGSALSDLTRVTDAIAGTLGLPERR